MMKSLLLQPCIKEAVAELPWQICDLAKVNADRCLALREVLERHQLHQAVHDHYDFRHLQLPEKLAHYAFRMLANGEVFPDDVSNVASGAGTGEAEPFYNGRQGQMFAPIFNMADSTALSYWDPRDQIPIPALPSPMTLELSETAAAVDHNTDSARTASQEAESILPQVPRLSGLMSDIRSDDWLLLELDKPYNL
jgi:hypothetical protein